MYSDLVAVLSLAVTTDLKRYIEATGIAINNGGRSGPLERCRIAPRKAPLITSGGIYSRRLIGEGDFFALYDSGVTSFKRCR